MTTTHETLQYAPAAPLGAVGSHDWSGSSWRTGALFWCLVTTQLLVTFLPLPPRYRFGWAWQILALGFEDIITDRKLLGSWGPMRIAICGSLALTSLMLIGWRLWRPATHGRETSARVVGWCVAGFVTAGMVLALASLTARYNPIGSRFPEFRDAWIALGLGGVATTWIAMRRSARWCVPGLLLSSYAAAAVFVVRDAGVQNPATIGLTIAIALTFAQLATMVFQSVWRGSPGDVKA